MNTDKPLGAAMLGIGLAGIAITLQIKARTFNDDPGPQLFPLFACAILVVCGLGMLLLSRPQARPEPVPGATGRGAVMAALMVFYAVALWLVGLHIATLLAVFAFYWVIAGPERRRPLTGAIYAACVTGGVHLVFAMLLNTFLPHGILI